MTLYRAPISLVTISTPRTVRAVASSVLPIAHGQSTNAKHTSQQRRHASILGSLSDNPGAYNKRIRRGRGPASGKGKTSGRGHKGQKQHGKVPAGFNGGQTPLEVVKGRKGFLNPLSPDMTTVNLDRVQAWIDQGRLDVSRPITLKELKESRCLHRIGDGVKLLARNSGTLRAPVHITVSRASAAAIAAVEAAGGSVTTRYYTRASINRILTGQTHPTLSLMSRPPSSDPAASSTTGDLLLEKALPPPSRFRYRLPDAHSRKDFEYYRDPGHRGYLAWQVREGESPSLFFRKPGVGVGVGGSVKKKKESGAAVAGEGRIW